MLSRIKEKKIYRYLSDTAIVGLIITISISTFQIFQASKQTVQLAESLQRIDAVEKSVTTHFLGTYPEYIDEINHLLLSFQLEKSSFANDTIIIFEDVLFYGYRSSPFNFINMHKALLWLADNGCHIVIAYYYPSKNNPVFNAMVQEELISPNLIVSMKKEIYDHRENREEIIEKYFMRNRTSSKEAAQAYNDLVSEYRKCLNSLDLPKETPLDREMITLSEELDSIKSTYMGKPTDDVSKIKYDDFLNMYIAFNNCIKQHYLRHERTNFVEIIELQEYMTMSCWLVRDRAVLAFPSKYATEEIGFISQDNAFVRYIHTMLNGVKSTTKINQGRNPNRQRKGSREN